MAKSYFNSGDYNAYCDICGWEYKASRMKKTWDGLFVCPKDFYTRQPLDFAVKLKDDPAPKITRPAGIARDLLNNELVSSGIIQFYNGVATSPYIPDITNSTIVSFAPNYFDGPHGFWTLSITAGTGFTIKSTQPMELSTVSYNINGGFCVSNISIAGFAVAGCMIAGK